MDSVPPVDGLSMVSEPLSGMVLPDVARGTIEPSQLGELLATYHERLARMIALRVDRRICARVDVDDIVQATFVQAIEKFADYVQIPNVSFYFWLRGVATNVLLEHHRRHLGTRMRDARLEVSLQASREREASSQAIAFHLAMTGNSPSSAAMAGELHRKLASLIDSLESTDREILVLRHIEQLTPTETASVLQITEKAAGMRYVRALKRLRQMLDDSSGARAQCQP